MAQDTAAKLVDLYDQAQTALVRIIRSKTSAGSAAVYERSLLRQIRQQLSALRKQSRELINALVRDNYETGLERLIRTLSIDDAAPKTYNMMSRLNTHQIHILAQNIDTDMQRAISLVGRRIEDAIRYAALDAAAKKLTTGRTVRQMAQLLEQQLHRTDITAVPYANGAQMPIKHYATMVARTTPAEIQNMAQITQGQAWGYDLVRMSKHTPTCAVCAMYQGRVYALTSTAACGKYTGPDGSPLYYPMLYDTALAHGYHTIHPHCRHRLSILPARAYTPAELANFSAQSMRPMTDSRSDQERKAYAADQDRKRRRNASYRQWQRVQAYLPADAPKTFAVWQRIKISDTTRYRQLMWDYKFLRRYGATDTHPALSHVDLDSIRPKLVTYSLNADHALGRHKAAVFKAALGYTIDHADMLASAIREALPRYRYLPRGHNGYGLVYNVLMLIDGANGNRQPVLTSWIHKDGETQLRMVTAYVKNNKRP